MQGKKLIFVTNNSTKSRKGYLGKFTSLGLSVKAEEIYSSSYAAAAYLESINFPQDKKVPPSSISPISKAWFAILTGRSALCNSSYKSEHHTYATQREQQHECAESSV